MPRSARTLLLTLASATLLVSAAVGATPRWHWQDEFADRDRDRLTDWVEHANAGLERLVGPLPYAFDVYFHRLDGRSEPVPWANTSKRGRSRAVNFHVDVAYPQSAFVADWTAAHELAHLMFPYLGRSGMWFAEGIASYLQYQAMYAAGVHGWDRAILRYRDRFTVASGSRRAGDVPIADMPRSIRETHGYVRMYWGGAAYFLEVDRRLAREHGLRLTQLIGRYLECCFGEGRDTDDMIRIFDRLSGSDVFRRTRDDTVLRSGFPPWEAALAWLAVHPPPLVRADGAESP